MNEKNAIAVLIQAAVIGQKAGAYSLHDAAVINSAIELLSESEKNDKQDLTNESSGVIENTIKVRYNSIC